MVLASPPRVWGQAASPFSFPSWVSVSASHCDNWPGSQESSSQSQHSKTLRSPWVALDVTELVGTLMVVLAR